MCGHCMGPCGCLTGLWTSISACVGPIRSTRATSGCFISRAIPCSKNPYGAFESLYIVHRPVSRLGTCTTPYECLRAFYGPTIVGSPVRKLCKLNFQLRTLWRPYRSKMLRARMTCCGITHRFSVWGQWTARELDVTEAFEWFYLDFPRAIDSYDTQTCTGKRPPVIDLVWPSNI